MTAKILTSVCLLFVACNLLAQEGQTLAFRRATHLQHGINTSIWFAQAVNNYGQDRLRNFTTEDDLRLIRRIGFDHIRLSVDAVPLGEWKRNAPSGTMFMGELDRVVHAALSDGLSVIIDVHPESSYKQRLLQGSDGVAQFTALWRALGTHFASTDPEHVFFEIMNEPEQPDSFRWSGIEAAVLEQIRAAAPGHTVIAAGAHWSGVEDLLALEPLADDNVIYTFHDYEPFAFTHQGATWTDPDVIPLRGVPYPALPAQVQQNVRQETSLASKWFVERYALDHWDAARIGAMMDYMAQWSQLHHAPVYCGEFGVHKPFAAAPDRERWLHDTRVAMEQHHIGWAMWDYQTNFGLVTKAGGETKVDQGVSQALGLKAGQ